MGSSFKLTFFISFLDKLCNQKEKVTRVSGNAVHQRLFEKSRSPLDKMDLATTLGKKLRSQRLTGIHQHQVFGHC